MKTLTHQQAQEILQAGQEVTQPVRESLAQHLATCADCRAYAALVNELAQVVPALYPSASLSEQAVRQKAAGKLPLVRRKSMMNRAITSTRVVVWASAALTFLLILMILSPRLLPSQPGIITDPTAIPSAITDIAATLTATKSNPTSTASFQYSVVEGDTLFGIAEKFNLKPETILWSNEDQLLDNPNNLQPGITLRIPTVDGLYYRWKTGDTIEAVAARFGVDPQAILDWPENAGPFEPRSEIFIPGGEVPLQAAPAVTPQFSPENDPTCTSEEVPLETFSSSQDSKTGKIWYTYTDSAHGFQFQFPAGWTMTQCVSQHPHYLQLRPSSITDEDIVLTIGIRLDSEDVYIMRTGVGSGDIIQQGTVQFLGRQATRDVLIEEGKTRSVLYDLGKEITRGSLVVTLGLDNFEYRKDADLSPEIQAAADQIVQSFALAPRANAMNEFELYFYRPLVVDYDPVVWEDRSEPDNKEMMVNYLQHREIESCIIGVRGASGFYPENMRDVTMGDITYQVYEQELAGGVIRKDYFFKSAPTEAFDEVLNTIGIPILNVQYESSQAQDCLAAAEEVFATLHPSERLINMPYCEKLARDYRTPPNQKTYCDPNYNFAFNYPQDWSIEPLMEVRDSEVLQFVRRMKRFQNPDKSNFIRVDTYRLPATSTLEETFKAHAFYPDREFPDHEYEELRIGGQRAYAFTIRLDQDYSAVYLFFQHDEYYSIMEIKAISSPKLDTNWKIARSIQVPGGTLDDNFFPDQLLIDSYQLVK